MHVFQEFLIVLWHFLQEVLISIGHLFVSPSEKSVRGETVLITGAGSGIGRLLCLEFAKRGAVVIACDINKAANQETAQLVQENDGTIYTYVCDVGNRDNIYKLAEQVKQNVGDVSILVNNAGVVTGKMFLDCPDHMIQKTIDVNLMAHFWTAKVFLPAMMRKNHGHIVNIASIAGIAAGTQMTDYCASKFGVVGFTESLQYELIAANKTGIHTTTVCPFLITTGMFTGFEPRFPSLIAPLDPKQTARTIMHAVLINQTLLCIPKAMYFVSLFKSILPFKATVILAKFLGAMDAMNKFVGRNDNGE